MVLVKCFGLNTQNKKNYASLFPRRDIKTLQNMQNNKIEGNPVLKLAMVKRFKVKKKSEKSKFKINSSPKFVTKIRHQNSSPKNAISTDLEKSGQKRGYTKSGS